jgi:hypothetical protein
MRIKATFNLTYILQILVVKTLKKSMFTVLNNITIENLNKTF